MNGRVVELLNSTLPDSKEREYYIRYAELIQSSLAELTTLNERLSFFAFLEGYRILFDDGLETRGPEDPLFVSDVGNLFAAFFPTTSDEREWWRSRFWIFVKDGRGAGLVNGFAERIRTRDGILRVVEVDVDEFDSL